MTYITLKNFNCSISSAILSNQKYILPNSKLYCKCCTDMCIYPGSYIKCEENKNKIILNNCCGNTNYKKIN
jgi:hypothetical protein